VVSYRASKRRPLVVLISTHRCVRVGIIACSPAVDVGSLLPSAISTAQALIVGGEILGPKKCAWVLPKSSEGNGAVLRESNGPDAVFLECHRPTETPVCRLARRAPPSHRALAKSVKPCSRRKKIAFIGWTATSPDRGLFFVRWSVVPHDDTTSVDALDGVLADES